MNASTKHGVRKWCLRFLSIVLVGLIIVTSIVLYNTTYLNQTFITTFYQVSSDKSISDVRVVLLTDLHLRQYGENNSELVRKINNLSPDIIMMVGDMTLNTIKDHSVVIDLIERLVQYAPVYYSAGNHEFDEIIYHEDDTLVKDINAAGAVYLSSECDSLEINGYPLLIGAMCKNRADALNNDKTRDMMEKLSNASEFTILMSHYPEVFLGGNGMEDYPVDLALCGHAHGGQIRLPLLGDGLYTPDQGFLPEMTSGLRTMDNGTQVAISRGLGDSNQLLPRIFNQPELVVIDIN